jgi:hypothetical protein
MLFTLPCPALATPAKTAQLPSTVLSLADGRLVIGHWKDLAGLSNSADTATKYFLIQESADFRPNAAASAALRGILDASAASARFVQKDESQMRKATVARISSPSDGGLLLRRRAFLF